MLVVDTDLIPTIEVDHITVVAQSPGSFSSTRDFPATRPEMLPVVLLIEPDGTRSNDVVIAAHAVDAEGTPRVGQRFTTTFVDGRTWLLEMGLSRDCEETAEACEDQNGMTCSNGQCVSTDLPPGEDTDVDRTRDRLFPNASDAGATDAGPPVDAGLPDAGAPDAGEPDAGMCGADCVPDGRPCQVGQVSCDGAPRCLATETRREAGYPCDLSGRVCDTEGVCGGRR